MMVWFGGGGERAESEWTWEVNKAEKAVGQNV